MDQITAKTDKLKKHLTVHSPLPSSLASECSKAASILSHFIKRKNQLDSTLIPEKILQNAKGIAVISVLKGGFMFSGRFGSGLVVSRLEDGRWSAPCSIMTTGFGFGAQIGGQLTDFVFILNTSDAVKAFSHGGNVTLGGNISVAAGPVGRSTEAAGAVLNLAPIYSYSKTKGLFAGLSLEGSVIVTRNEANELFYNRKVSAKEILSGAVEPPSAADPLYRALNQRFGSIPTEKNNYDHSFDHRFSSPPAYTSPSDSFNHPFAPSAESYIDSKPIISKKPPPVPARANKPKHAIALYSFTAEQNGDLSFIKGDVIEVVKKTESSNDWWVGRIRGQEGAFPANYVELQ